jgi:serine/threonine protein kinase
LEALGASPYDLLIDSVGLQAIRATPSRDPPTTSDFLRAAAGLAAIEKQHLVHRDIKPSNIMVSLQDGKLANAKIIDLGLAKGVAEEHTLSTVGAFVGTPAYASPEQFAGIVG